jgi:3-phosphoshikimate 1-carboxyvinyltransferase
VPGSKSITNRALILAALAQGETILRGALWSEDTQVMVECLQELGFMANVARDPHEPGNRLITVYGKGGSVPSGGTEEHPLDLFVGNAGTAARFLAAFVCLGKGVYRLQGIARMQQRPQAALFRALRQLGYRIDSPNNKLPAVIHGAGPLPGKCEVRIDESSQFASALLLSAGSGGWQVTIIGEDQDEAAYVAMTSKLIEAFPKTESMFQIEPDASSGSYFLAADAISGLNCSGPNTNVGSPEPMPQKSGVSVRNWPNSGWQIDQHFKDMVGQDTGNRRPRFAQSVISRQRDLGDSIMTAIVLSPLASKPTRFTDLGRLRVQECERVAALRTELTKCGAQVIESGDTLEIFPSELRGAEIETYNDHRMAMCFAILGLRVPGIRIKNPACVKKTFPNFFQKIADSPPDGLGATIVDGRRRVLGFEELFAD